MRWADSDSSDEEEAYRPPSPREQEPIEPIEPSDDPLPPVLKHANVSQPQVNRREEQRATSTTITVETEVMRRTTITIPTIVVEVDDKTRNNNKYKIVGMIGSIWQRSNP